MINIHSYIERNNIVLNTPGSIDKNGNSFRFVNGKKISEEKFQSMHPPVVIATNKYKKDENIGCIE
jgi:hypothetical protein